VAAQLENRKINSLYCQMAETTVSK